MRIQVGRGFTERLLRGAHLGHLVDDGLVGGLPNVSQRGLLGGRRWGHAVSVGTMQWGAVVPFGVKVIQRFLKAIGVSVADRLQGCERSFGVTQRVVLTSVDEGMQRVLFPCAEAFVVLQDGDGLADHVRDVLQLGF